MGERKAYMRAYMRQWRAARAAAIEPKLCQFCGQTYTPGKHDFRSKFCSPKCAATFHSHTDKRRKYSRDRYAAQIAAERRRSREKVMRLKDELLANYGRECACCGESHKEFLTLDHVGGWGKDSRKTHGQGAGYWYYLKRMGWPKDGYRILCMNCNFVRRYGGMCPHEQATQI